MKELVIELLGPPVPKGRPRVVITNRGKRRTYTPAATEAAEEAIIWLCRAQRVTFGDSLVSVEMWFHTRHKRLDGDNCEKLALDAMTRAGVYDDDSQVVDVHWRLRRVEKGEPEFTRVRVVEA